MTRRPRRPAQSVGRATSWRHPGFWSTTGAGAPANHPSRSAPWRTFRLPRTESGAMTTTHIDQLDTIEALNARWVHQMREQGMEPQVRPEDVPSLWERALQAQGRAA